MNYTSGNHMALQSRDSRQGVIRGGGDSDPQSWDSGQGVIGRGGR